MGLGGDRGGSSPGHGMPPPSRFCCHSLLALGTPKGWPVGAAVWTWEAGCRSRGPRQQRAGDGGGAGWKPLTASHLWRERPLPPGGSGSRPLSCRQDPCDFRRKGLGRPGCPLRLGAGRPWLHSSQREPVSRRSGQGEGLNWLHPGLRGSRVPGWGPPLWVCEGWGRGSPRSQPAPAWPGSTPVSPLFVRTQGCQVPGGRGPGRRRTPHAGDRTSDGRGHPTHWANKCPEWLSWAQVWENWKAPVSRPQRPPQLLWPRGAPLGHSAQSILMSTQPSDRPGKDEPLFQTGNDAENSDLTKVTER